MAKQGFWWAVAAEALHLAADGLKDLAQRIDGTAEPERMTLGQILDESEVEGQVVTTAAQAMLAEQRPETPPPPRDDDEPERFPLEGSLAARFPLRFSRYGDD